MATNLVNGVVHGKAASKERLQQAVYLRIGPVRISPVRIGPVRIGPVRKSSRLGMKKRRARSNWDAHHVGVHQVFD
jgi:hypothetical protein